MALRCQRERRRLPRRRSVDGRARGEGFQRTPSLRGETACLPISSFLVGYGEEYTRYMHINDPLTATKTNTHKHTDKALQHASAPEYSGALP